MLLFELVVGGVMLIFIVLFGIVIGVFGMYGGVESWFLGVGGVLVLVVSLCVLLWVLELFDLGDGFGGVLMLWVECWFGECVMCEVWCDFDYFDDWFVCDYLNVMVVWFVVVVVVCYIGGYVLDFDLFLVCDL